MGFTNILVNGDAESAPPPPTIINPTWCSRSDIDPYEGAYKWSIGGMAPIPPFIPGREGVATWTLDLVAGMTYSVRMRVDPTYALVSLAVFVNDGSGPGGTTQYGLSEGAYTPGWNLWDVCTFVAGGPSGWMQIQGGMPNEGMGSHSWGLDAIEVGYFTSDYFPLVVVTPPDGPAESYNLNALASSAGAPIRTNAGYEAEKVQRLNLNRTIIERRFGWRPVLRLTFALDDLADEETVLAFVNACLQPGARLSISLDGGLHSTDCYLETDYVRTPLGGKSSGLEIDLLFRGVELVSEIEPAKEKIW